MMVKYLKSCGETQPGHYLRNSKGTGRILAPWEHDLQNKSFITSSNNIPWIDCTSFYFMNRIPFLYSFKRKIFV